MPPILLPQSFLQSKEVLLTDESHSALLAAALPARKPLETSLLGYRLSWGPKLQSVIAKFWV